MAKKRECPSVASLIREVLERNADATIEDVQKELKQMGRKCTIQNFYSTRHTWKKKKHPVGMAQKKKINKRRPIQRIPIIGDSEIQLAILRRENQKLKDIIMRFMLD